MSDRNFPAGDRCEDSQIFVINNTVGVQWMYKWDTYHRLKALDIDCRCKTNQPLLVELNTPKTAIQVWSVVKHLSASRQELISWLDHCWQLQ